MKWSIMAPLRIAVLDDHSLIQMALELRLSREADLKVVGVYSNSRDLLASLTATPADLLVLDYSLGASELDGLHLIGLIRRRFPSLCILVASSAESPSVVNLSLSVGANGFFGKSESAELLVEAIRKVAYGETYVSPGLAYRLGRQPLPAGRASPDVKGGAAPVERPNPVAERTRSTALLPGWHVGVADLAQVHAQHENHQRPETGCFPQTWRSYRC
nr:response regulator transcription factor [Stenotrophomonas terrae]